MKNFPFIPMIMITVMTLVIIHGHKVSRQNENKANYSMAAGVDAHLTTARKAFIDQDNFVFNHALADAMALIAKEAYCEKCIDKEIAEKSLQPLVDIKHKYEANDLQLEDMDKVFGSIITALAKNHIVYTIEHLAEDEKEFYLQDAVRHLKFSMKYVDKDVQEKEKIATDALENALTTHEIDPEETKKVLEEVVSGI